MGQRLQAPEPRCQVPGSMLQFCSYLYSASGVSGSGAPFLGPKPPGGSQLQSCSSRSQAFRFTFTELHFQVLGAPFHLYSRPEAPGSRAPLPGPRPSVSALQRAREAPGLRSFSCRFQALRFTFTVGQRLQTPELYLNCKMSSFTSSASPCKMRDKERVARSTVPRASMPVGARQKRV